MTLVDYLSRDAICMDLEPETRDDALRTMLERVARAGMVPQERLDGVLAALLDREQRGSTAIGRGVAVPHAKIEDLDHIVVSFGYSSRGVEFKALDGEPVHQIFLVLACPDAADDYIDVLQRITRLVRDDDFRRFISQAADSQAVLELLEEMDT